MVATIVVVSLMLVVLIVIVLAEKIVPEVPDKVVALVRARRGWQASVWQ